MDIAVVGTSTFTSPFRLAGVKRAYNVSNEKELQNLLNDLLNDKSLGILILNDKQVSMLPIQLKQKMWASIRPVVISIGSNPEMDIRERIKQAIGVDLF